MAEERPAEESAGGPVAGASGHAVASDAAAGDSASSAAGSGETVQVAELIETIEVVEVTEAVWASSPSRVPPSPWNTWISS